MLTDNKLENVEDYEKVLKQQAMQISEDLLKNIDNIYNPEFIQKLNEDISRSRVFETVYGEEKRQLSNVINKILDKIRVDAAKYQKKIEIYKQIFT
jgi:hypothetical protein